MVRIMVRRYILLFSQNNPILRLTRIVALKTALILGFYTTIPCYWYKNDHMFRVPHDHIFFFKSKRKYGKRKDYHPTKYCFLFDSSAHWNAKAAMRLVAFLYVRILRLTGHFVRVNTHPPPLFNLHIIRFPLENSPSVVPDFRIGFQLFKSAKVIA